MNQNYNKYTTEDHEVWSTLFIRQISNLEGVVAQTYLDSINELHPAFRSDAVPNFNEVDELLLAKRAGELRLYQG